MALIAFLFAGGAYCAFIGLTEGNVVYAFFGGWFLRAAVAAVARPHTP